MNIFQIPDDDALRIATQVVDTIEPILEKLTDYDILQQTAMVRWSMRICDVFVDNSGLGIANNRMSRDDYQALRRRLFVVMEGCLDKIKDDRVLASALMTCISIICPSKEVQYDVPTYHLVLEDAVIHHKCTEKNAIYGIEACENLLWSNLLLDKNQESIDFVNKCVLSHLYSQYESVRRSVLSIYRACVRQHAVFWPELFISIYYKCCDVIVSETKTESEFRGSCEFIGLCYPTLHRIPGRIPKLFQALITAKANKEWGVDQLFEQLLDKCRQSCVGWQRSDLLLPYFKQVQDNMLDWNRELITEYEWNELPSYVSRGLDGCNLKLFIHLWNTTFSCENRRESHYIVWRLYEMKQLLVTNEVTFDHFPDEEYMVDRPGIRFACEPSFVKVQGIDDTIPSDYKFTDVRDWIRTNMTATMITKMMNMIYSLLIGTETEIIRTSFWTTLFELTGSSVLPLLDHLIKIHEDDWKMTVVIAEIVVGMACGSRSWSLADNLNATSTVVRRFVRQLSETECTDICDDVLTEICRRSDIRRHMWLLDVAKDYLASENSTMLRNVMTILQKCQRFVHPKYNGILSTFVKEQLFPKVLPLSAQTKGIASGVARVLDSIY